MSMRKRSVTLRQLREKFGELLISNDQPVVVTKDGIPLGFFIPAKVWKKPSDSELSDHFLELALVHAGQSRDDLKQCGDDIALRKKMETERRNWSAEFCARKIGLISGK